MGTEPPGLQIPPRAKAMRPNPGLVLVQPVAILLAYVAISSVLGLLTPSIFFPVGLEIYSRVWGSNTTADLVFVVGSMLVALLMVNGGRRTGPSFKWVFLWVPLAYVLTFAVYSMADSATSADGSCGVGCAAGQVVLFGQPGLIFASLAPAWWVRRGRVARPPAADPGLAR